MNRVVTKSKINIIADILFYIALTIEILIVILDKSAYLIQYEGYWFRLTFLLFGFKILLTKYSVKEWCAIFLFGMLGAVSYYITGKNEIIRLVVMIAACKEMDFDKMFCYLFYTTLTGCLVIIGLSFGGIGTFEITTDFGRGMIQTRYCLGLGHPNALHCMSWALITLYLYCYREKLKWFHFAVLLVINHVIYILTDSRTGVIVAIFTILLAWFMNGIKKLRYYKPLYIFSIIGVVGLFIFSALMAEPNMYQRVFVRLDDLITGRIRNTLAIISGCHLQNWTLFGEYGSWAQTDLGFVKLVYWFGLIPAIIYLIMCCLLIWTAYKEKDYMAMVLVVSISIYTVFEGHDISVYHGRNYLYFLWGKYWSKMLKAGSTDERYLWKVLSKRIVE